jgi:hypothetical protein
VHAAVSSVVSTTPSPRNVLGDLADEYTAEADKQAADERQ